MSCNHQLMNRVLAGAAVVLVSSAGSALASISRCSLQRVRVVDFWASSNFLSVRMRKAAPPTAWVISKAGMSSPRLAGKVSAVL